MAAQVHSFIAPIDSWPATMFFLSLSLSLSFILVHRLPWSEESGFTNRASRPFLTSFLLYGYTLCCALSSASTE